jgi:hypothetical protein
MRVIKRLGPFDVYTLDVFKQCSCDPRQATHIDRRRILPFLIRFQSILFRNREW